MNTLLRRSASIAPAASRQTLAALLRLIPSESFSSSAISQLDHVNGSSQTKKGGAFEIRSKAFHFAAPTRSSGFRAKKGEDDKDLVIANLNIDERIVRYLKERRITKLFPRQRACFELAMQGRDMIGRAKTGTWNTRAFGIPIMDKILRQWDTNGCLRNPLALVLAPTGELARQVEIVFRESAPLDTVCAYVGMTIEDQITTLNYGVDVVFGTPERIIYLAKLGALHLKDVQFVVLDGADQMLAVGSEAVETILENLPSNRQSLVFSDTMPQAVENLTRKYLKDPATIDLHTGQMGGGGVGGNIRTNKIYVGRLPPTLTLEELTHYFQNYGIVTDVVVKYDPNTQQPRRFGFTFDNEDAVDQVLQLTFHRINGKPVDVQHDHQKDANPNSGSGDRSGGGGSYQSYFGDRGGGAPNSNSAGGAEQGASATLNGRFDQNEREFGPDKIVFEGCDYNHWLILMDFPEDPEQGSSPVLMIKTYFDTAANVFGSMVEAKKRIYALSTTTYHGFQCLMDKATSEKFRGLPGVVFIMPDSYIDPVNKEYGGDICENGLIIPRPPPMQYGDDRGTWSGCYSREFYDERR